MDSDYTNRIREIIPGITEEQMTKLHRVLVDFGNDDRAIMQVRLSDNKYFCHHGNSEIDIDDLVDYATIWLRTEENDVLNKAIRHYMHERRPGCSHSELWHDFAYRCGKHY